MIFAREISDPLTSLVKKIDAETAKHATANMGSFVVFLSDDEKLPEKLKASPKKQASSTRSWRLTTPPAPMATPFPRKPT